MSISNKSTTVPAEKTVAEIQSMLAAAKANALMIDYEGGVPSAISFRLVRGNSSIAFKLPSNWQGLLVAMKKDKSIPKRLLCEEHARRVSWRVIRDWLKAQLTLIEAGASTIEEVMLPWAVTNDGTTVGQRLLTAGGNSILALPAPKD